MPRGEKQKIWGYVDLTPEFREQIVELKSKQRFAQPGWKVIPAHHRQHPPTLILHGRDPDTSDSNMYWFDNPEKRDQLGNVIKEPLPIKSERDLKFFQEQNAKFMPKRFAIRRAMRDFIQEYDPDLDFVERTGKAKGMREEQYQNVGAEVDGIQASVDVDTEQVHRLQAALDAAKPKNKGGRPRKNSKTESRLVDSQ